MVNRSIHNDWKLKTTILDAGFTLDKDVWTLEGTVGYTTQTQKIDQIESRVNANKVAGVTVEFADNGAPIYDLATNGGYRNNELPKYLIQTMQVLIGIILVFTISQLLKTMIN